MGNYVFTTKTLVDIVSLDAEDQNSHHDIGGSIVPALVDAGEAHVYDFTTNHVPGETERDHAYWRDVGSLDSYYDAHMDLVSVHPIFNLYNREWPILTSPEPLPPASFVPPGVVSTKQFPPLGWRFALMNSPSDPSVFASQCSMWPLRATATQFSFISGTT